MNLFTIALTAIIAFLTGLFRGRRSSAEVIDNHVTKKTNELDQVIKENEAETLLFAQEEAAVVMSDVEGMTLQEQTDEVANILNGEDK
tara:strand:+ start:14470 stop:14733 length:264 start_codon:yes stop_codon:yes gene_type:complete